MKTPEEVVAGLDLVHVPTVKELHAEGLAKEIVEHVGKSNAKRISYRLKPKGQKRIYKAMAHNAEILKTLEADYQAAHAKELKWRAEADRLMHIRNLAAKGI